MKHARDDYNRIQDPAGLIPEDEPVFLVRGQDMSAPATVEAWADEHERNGGDPALATIARQQAMRMREYQTRTARRKIADW